MTIVHDHILVPVDFEPASLRALDLAIELAGALGARVTVVHVYQLPVYTYPGLAPAPMPGFHAEVEAAARKALEHLVSTRAAFPLAQVLRAGDVAEEILRTAIAARARLIVMGTHGRSGLSHLLLGSVAERVIRRSPVPVMTVRQSEQA